MSGLRAAVIGVGYLGRFHAQKYRDHAGVTLAGVADASPERAGEVAQEVGCPAFADYRELFGKVDLVSVVVPTQYHHEVAKACLEQGIHVLLEKPITQTVAEADELIQIAAERRLVLQVGHLERFNPAVRALQGVLLNPLFIESHRLAPFKPRGTDVNVVLDLMIHDIDILLSLVRHPITTVNSVGVPVLSGEVDIANVMHLRAQIVQAVPNAAPGLILDLSATTYLDSRGVHLILELADRMGTSQQELRVVIPPGAPVRRVLELTHVDSAVCLDLIR